MFLKQTYQIYHKDIYINLQGVEEVHLYTQVLIFKLILYYNNNIDIIIKSDYKLYLHSLLFYQYLS